ncbi:methionyl-tRNA formyltransferase [Streptobacillus felis]|uniref:Methionyl-tRNA formyltransferase n=1 Tax=Streptobacillus felis TaxID=1384509 RepID=A0A7Z0TCC3_9FUSO|nr:methionyl-tRNA formyltransferase [Streptobacillus felis]NYV28268.1 methionyl-tRNA formyltransferase [Streptobacillus felis]
MRTIFMGTPDFAFDTLKYIHENTELLAVFTKVDKVNARGNKIIFSPVKQYALDNNIEIVQPKSLRTDDVYELLKEYNADLIIVVAYGMIIPKNIIDLPKYGIINVHSSLLPKYRGAAPIHAAILNGDEKTGVSIMYIDEKLDEGDVICTLETEIKKEDNLGTLHDRLKVLGAEGVKQAVEMMKNGTVKATKQDHSLATFVKPIKKEETKVDFSKDSLSIFNKIRGLNPFPEAYTTLNGKVLKLYASDITQYIGDEEPGTVIDLTKEGIVVKTGDGAIIIKELKLEGKKKQSSLDFINGRQINKLDVLK